MTDMDEGRPFLGRTATGDFDKGTLAISEEDYVQNILERFGMLKYNKGNTPLDIRARTIERAAGEKLLARGALSSARLSRGRFSTLHRLPATASAIRPTKSQTRGVSPQRLI